MCGQYPRKCLGCYETISLSFVLLVLFVQDSDIKTTCVLIISLSCTVYLLLPVAFPFPRHKSVCFPKFTRSSGPALHSQRPCVWPSGSKLSLETSGDSWPKGNPKGMMFDMFNMYCIEYVLICLVMVISTWDWLEIGCHKRNRHGSLSPLSPCLSQCCGTSGSHCIFQGTTDQCRTVACVLEVQKQSKTSPTCASKFGWVEICRLCYVYVRKR